VISKIEQIKLLF